MIKQRYAKALEKKRYLPRQFGVRTTGSWIARRMVVRENDRAGVGIEHRTNHLARRKQGALDATCAQMDFSNQMPAGIKKEKKH